MTRKGFIGMLLTAFLFILPAMAQNGDPNGCEKFLQRLGEKIEKAKTVVMKSTNEEAKKILNEGIASYQKALDLQKQNKIKEAFEEAKNAHKLVMKSLSMVNANGCNGNGCNNQNLDQYIKNLGDKIAKTKDVAIKANNAEAIKLVNEATVHYDKGVQLKKDGKIQEAWDELRASSKLVSEAMKILNMNGCNGNGNCGNIQKMFKQTEQMLAKAKVIVEKSGKEEAKKMLETANAHYAKAVELNKQNKPKEAKEELKLAKESAQKAIEIAQKP